MSTENDNMSDPVETIEQRTSATDTARINDATILDIFDRLKRVKETNAFTPDEQLMISPHVVMRLVHEVIQSRAALKAVANA